MGFSRFPRRTVFTRRLNGDRGRIYNNGAFAWFSNGFGTRCIQSGRKGQLTWRYNFYFSPARTPPRRTGTISRDNIQIDAGRYVQVDGPFAILRFTPRYFTRVFRIGLVTGTYT